MITVLLIIHIFICVAMIGAILMQRSEGGALGIGGGGGGGLMSGRGAANALTKATSVMAAMFFGTSILLTILANVDRGSTSVIDRVDPQVLEETIEIPDLDPAAPSIPDDG